MSKDYLNEAYQDVILEVRGRIAYVTLNRPHKLNAMTMNTKGEIVRIFQGLDQDPDVWGVIVTGAGKSFNVGSDVSHHPASCEEAFDEITFSQNVLNTIEKCSKPVIAAINGYCLGGGIELALVCDLRIASEKASFGLPEAKLGVIPSYGGTQRLTRLCGAALAKDLCFTCRRMPADEALSWHLINRLVPDANLRTAEISDAHHTGQHTTTFSEMISLPDVGWLIDTPGIKVFGTFDMEPEELTSYFPEIFRFSKDCRFSNCTHTHEPGCAVLQALEDHFIAQSRYQSYLSMMEDKDGSKYREAY